MVDEPVAALRLHRLRQRRDLADFQQLRGSKIDRAQEGRRRRNMLRSRARCQQCAS